MCCTWLVLASSCLTLALALAQEWPCCAPGQSYNLTVRACEGDAGNSSSFSSRCAGALVDHLLDGGDVVTPGGGGSAMWRGEVLAAGTFCLAELDEGGRVLRTCEDAAQYCATHPCVSKCCPYGMSKISRSCNATDRGNSPDLIRAWPDLAVVGTKPKCVMFPLQPDTKPNDMHWLEKSPNGFLELVVPSFSYRLRYDRFCYEHVFKPPALDGYYAFVCFPEEHSDETTLQVRAGFLVFSSVCVLITLLVYSCLPSLQNLHGQTVMCHLFSLMVSFICVSALAVASRKVSTSACRCIGFTMFFFFIAAFSWLNVMCFDIWRTFGAVHSRYDNGSRRSRARRTFAAYSLYAWGVPSIITAAVIVVDKTKGISGFGNKSCFLENYSQAYLIYFSVPVGIQQLLNLVIFILSVRRCWKVQAELERLQATCSTSSHKKRYLADRSKLMMNGKLFIVMGLSWIFEFIQVFTGPEPAWLWYIPDMFNCVHGVFIAAIYILKRRVLYALARRLGCIKAQPNATRGQVTSGVASIRCQNPAQLKSLGSSSTLFTTISR